jgi:hypothetical protein
MTAANCSSRSKMMRMQTHRMSSPETIVGWPNSTKAGIAMNDNDALYCMMHINVQSSPWTYVINDERASSRSEQCSMSDVPSHLGYSHLHVKYAYPSHQPPWSSSKVRSEVDNAYGSCFGAFLHLLEEVEPK